MTTVRIQLPDALALEAERAGLLAPEAIEKILREQLKSKRVDQLFVAIDKMAAVPEPEEMPPADIAEEIRKMRAERRARQAE
ncbi:MAG TPA: hypothetical protein VKB38_22965 [Terracidiphilus sp.]|nr:hypothetical protein [Terracidiphilus sp.]